ncbi:MAG: AMP-binding protein [Atopobiaceae bacterium]|nr:AMP-binding protein [Atopobiaceae bacterium]
MLFSEFLGEGPKTGTALADSHFTCTHAEFRAAVAGFAAHLHELGLARGERVAIWGYNSVNWLVAFYGIIRAGGVAVLINYSLDVSDAAELARRANARFLVCADNGTTKRGLDAISLVAAAANLDPACCIDARNESCNLVHAYAHTPALDEQRSPEQDAETAIIIFTSGTTSAPKAVRISQRALTADAHALAAGLEDRMGVSLCVSVPLFHILGLLVSFIYLSHGATVLLPADYRGETIEEMVSAHHASDLVAVGAVYQNLSASKDFQDKVVPHVQLCLIAGGMSTPVQMMRLELDFANAIFINMYGLSEGAPITMVRPSDLIEQRASTVGRAVEGVELSIASATGEKLAQGEVGEVIARGDFLMDGYEGLPSEQQPIDKKGWLHTGDLGYLDEDGYLHLSGRLKDVIIRGGENIAPSEVESELAAIEGVRDVKVMGAPHPIFGESVESCVQMEEGAIFDAEHILASLREKLPRYKVPAHVFEYDTFPLNVNGKIDQRALYVDMVRRLHKLELDHELVGGITVFDCKLKNVIYAINPVAGMVDSLADAVGFNKRRAMQLRLAVEEMLTERIMDAYSGAGDIHVKLTLMPDWLRVSFSDDGVEYVIDKRRDTSMSAKIILGSVDDFHTEWRDGKPIYCMDFLYDDYLDIKAFLLKSSTQAE